MVWIDFSRTFRELFCGLEIMVVVLELFGGYFWWIIRVGNYLQVFIGALPSFGFVPE
ncbi:proteoglycan 4-like [Iris pallida]|uniref:Proteoglycan 4-like n=1 Tax=Iris pallida TaxID=29817 RepID=A0AAX6DFB8_IRIPA|nr:proteoglycan 4-like [Iris pallida]KAJ6790453.1 proteoglycan 4-like [Iris pallida]KAJ6834134.1 proteoglycan 4-like [Iris pallida]KAJ6834135.1 proteoglycan 4-like [Iris pallida]